MITHSTTKRGLRKRVGRTVAGALLMLCFAGCTSIVGLDKYDDYQAEDGGGECVQPEDSVDALFAFDSNIETWMVFGDGEPSMEWVPDEGSNCQGALSVTMAFSASGGDGDQGMGASVFIVDPSKDWSGRTTLHLWLKISVPDSHEHVNSFTAQVQSNGFGNTASAQCFSDQVMRATECPFTLADRGCFDEGCELVYDLTGATASGSRAALTDGEVDLTSVDAIQLALFSNASVVDSPETTIYVDDIWLE